MREICAPWYAPIELPPKVAGVQGKMTPRRMTNLDPKGRGDKSMIIKRGITEDVYVMVLQRLRDRAKAELSEP